MQNKAEILGFLSRKRELLLIYETVTGGMLYEDDAEALEANVAQRQEILDKAASLDRQIRQCCEGNQEMLRALNHQCDRGNLTADLADLYDASLNVRAVGNRIQGCDEAVMEHMELVREKLKEKIEEVNSGGYAVASKYYRAAQTGVLRSTMDERNRKV